MRQTIKSLLVLGMLATVIAACNAPEAETEIEPDAPAVEEPVEEPAIGEEIEPEESAIEGEEGVESEAEGE